MLKRIAFTLAVLVPMPAAAQEPVYRPAFECAALALAMGDDPRADKAEQLFRVGVTAALEDIQRLRITRESSVGFAEALGRAGFLAEMNDEFLVGIFYANINRDIAELLEGIAPYDPDTTFEMNELVRHFAAVSEFERRNCDFIANYDP